MTSEDRPRRRQAGGPKTEPRAGADSPPKKQAPPAVPKLTEQNLAQLGKAMHNTGALRRAFMSALAEHNELSKEDGDAINVLVGRFARIGRDLAEPLEVSRHRTIQYFDRILCGLEFHKADPQATYGPGWKQRLLFRTVDGWRKQLDRHLEKNPDLRMSLSEAMGLPKDEDEE